MRFTRSIAIALTLPGGAAASQIIPPPIVPTVDPSPAVAPEPTPQPTPEPSARPRVPSPRRVAAPPSPRGIATPLPTPSTTPATTAPVPRVPLQPPRPTDAGPADTGAVWPYAALALGGLAIGAGGFLRLRRAAPVESGAPVEDAAIPIAAGTPVVATTIDYRATRIGLNLISATVDGEVTVVAGSTPVEAMEIRVALLGIASDLDTAVDAVRRSPPARTAVPAFALAAGEGRTVRAIAPIARDAIASLSAGGRPIFVPLVVVVARWREGGVDQHRTSTFAVGIERVDSPRLAPVWLDQDSRTHDSVATRPHGPVLASSPD